MEYRVKHMETDEEKMLSHLEVNDMVYRDNGQIIIFDISMGPYLLLDENL